jgi:hypothetical protein
MAYRIETEGVVKQATYPEDSNFHSHRSDSHKSYVPPYTSHKEFHGRKWFVCLFVCLFVYQKNGGGAAGVVK